jgi:hypothetical protein
MKAAKKQFPLVTTDPDAFGLPGVVLVVDPDEAEDLGACPEPALSPEDAWDSNSDEGGGE